MEDSESNGEKKRVVISFDEPVDEPETEILSDDSDTGTDATLENTAVLIRDEEEEWDDDEAKPNESESDAGEEANPPGQRRLLGRRTQIALAGITAAFGLFLVAALTVLAVASFTELLPEGRTGPIGKTGVQGEPGLKGLKGFKGTDGRDGRDGTDGTDGFDGMSVSICSNNRSDPYFKQVPFC